MSIKTKRETPVQLSEAAMLEFATERLAREPALLLAQRFSRFPSRWLAAVVFIEELHSAMFGLSNLTVAHAKLSWWADEADLTAAGAPRHPLTQYLLVAGTSVALLPKLVRAALLWLDQPTAQDQQSQREQFGQFATLAAEFVDEGDEVCAWVCFALKRQAQFHAKPDRYGPAVFSRARMAEFQLKSSQIADRSQAGAALQAQLVELANDLRMDRRKQRSRSATRALAILHAKEASNWAKGNSEFQTLRLTPLAVLAAWWHGRG